MNSPPKKKKFQDVVQSLKSTSTRFNSVRRRNRSSPTQRQQPFPTRTSNYEDYADELSLHTADSQHGVPITSSSPRFQKMTDFFDHYLSSSSRRYMRHQIQKHLFPSFIGFRKKSIFSKISSVLSAPVFFLLATTLPVVKESVLSVHSSVQLNDDTAELLQDYDDNEDQQNDILMNAEEATWLKWLTAVQLIGGPILISFVLITQDVFSAAVVLPVAFIGSTAVSVAFWFTTKSTKQPRLYWMMCFLGFGIAVVWIFLIANEVVSVLQAIGMAVGASEAILGLTIFALVNFRFF